MYEKWMRWGNAKEKVIKLKEKKNESQHCFEKIKLI
jgi:hypothetical protein